MASATLSIQRARTGRLAALLERGKSGAGKGSFALLDQGLLACSNFLITMLLARQLTPEQYGAYALAFEAFLLLSVLYAAFVLEPMSVFGQSVYRDNMKDYFGVLFRLHPEVSLVILVVFGTWAYVAHILAQSRALPQALAGMCLAAPVVLLLWVVRRAFYVKLSPKVAATGGAVYCGSLLTGLLVVYKMGWLSPFMAFMLMALGAAAAGPYLLSQLKAPLKPGLAAPTTAEVVQKHWTYGRWAVLSAVAAWASDAVYYFAMSSSHGLADAGAMKALLNLSSPVGQVFAALSLLTLPFASKTHRQKGPTGVRKVAWQLMLVYVGGNLAYWMVIVLFRSPILHLMYGGKYPQLLALVPWIGLASLLRIATTARAIPLRAVKAPSLVFFAYGVSTTIDCLVGAPMVWRFGLRGFVWTDVASNAVALIVVSVLLRRKLRSEEVKADAENISLGKVSLQPAV
jgi:O-antigen/teichoic acid export membrane protein